MKITIDGDIYEIKKRKGQEGEVSDDYLLGILRGVHSAMGNYSSRGDVIEVLEDAIPSFMELVEYEDEPIVFEF